MNIVQWNKLLYMEIYNVQDANGTLLARITQTRITQTHIKWRWQIFQVSEPEYEFKFGIVDTLGSAKMAVEKMLLQHGFRVLSDREKNLL